MVIAIEAGHRRNTPGKRSPDQKFREWEWNEKCKNITLNALCAKGLTVFDVTPQGDEDSLSRRVAAVNNLCNRYGKRNVVYVSIHCNAAGNGDWMNARRWSIWTSKGQTTSDVIAERIYEAALDKWGKAGVRSETSDGDHDYESDFYVLRNSWCPAVLIENFFYDNKEDYEYLCSPQSLEDCSAVIIDGLERYMATI